MRTWATVYGIFFLVLGSLGFIPAWFVQGFLLKGFETTQWTNISYLIAGAFALFVTLLPRPFVRLYFQMVGIIFLILGIGGFVFLDRKMHISIASRDNNSWLLIIAGTIGLILGLLYRSRDERTKR